MPASDDPAIRSPSTAPVSLARKGMYSARLVAEYAGRRHDDTAIGALLEDIHEYSAVLERHGGTELSRARAFEIGYGARPYRLIALIGMGVDARGVDAEVPILRGSPGEYARALRANGVERVAKSLVRRGLFDRRERRQFGAALAARGYRVTVRPERFLVGDAGDADLDRGSLDLVYSEDVFEHIAPASLERLLAKMAGWLAPAGLALIRPNVFTGITGGHLLEWNRRSFLTGRARRTGPWDHLKQGDLLTNTYLNRLQRADYRELFTRHFEILEETVKLADLGRDLLTPELRTELAGFSDEELFSNQVLFVLRPRV